MRMVLPIAALLLLSADVQAQQLTEPRASSQVPAVEAKLAPSPTVLNVQQTPTDVKPIRQTTERRATAESAREAVAEEAATQTVPRGFWWLVAAIVVGGIILAVIL